MTVLRMRASWLGLTVLACGGSTESDPADTTAGRQPGDHVTDAGTTTGGTGTSGASTGGDTGGRTDTGGADTGGTAGAVTSGAGPGLGGAGAGGSGAGGAGTGGADTGGADTGGAAGAVTSGAGPGPGGAGAGGAGTGGVSTGGVNTGGTVPGCFVGVRINDCCSEPIPADEADADDPCLRPYQSHFSAEELAGCPEAEACLAYSCVHPPPASRAVRRLNGECVFDHECLLAAMPSSFCSVATDYNTCCSCPEAMPILTIEADPCILAEGTPAPGTCGDCSDASCPTCNSTPPAVSCDSDSDTRLMVCRGVAP